MKNIFINMTWEDCNPNATIEASEQTEGYYTFGDAGYENVKAKGYKKITYKNLYPGIDVEYIIPEEGGIKYSLIISPNADLSKIKMRYTGDIEEIKTDIEGSIIIKTEAGDIIDHAPLCFYKNTREPITFDIKLNENTISFSLPESCKRDKYIFTETWTITPELLSYPAN